MNTRLIHARQVNLNQSALGAGDKNLNNSAKSLLKELREGIPPGLEVYAKLYRES